MPITNAAEYQEAQDALANGEGDAGKLRLAISRYRSMNPQLAGVPEEGLDPLIRTGKLDAPQDVAEAKPRFSESWIPERQLGATDYVPADMGGKLRLWHDMPVETYREKVYAAEREAKIVRGIEAQRLLSVTGAAAYDPEALLELTTAIAEGNAAAAKGPEQVTENDPGYKAFNDSEWQKAISEHVLDPEAGPMQRLSKVKGTGGTLLRASEYPKELVAAAGRGAFDNMTLGLGHEAQTQIENRLSPGAGDMSEAMQEAHPIASGVGAGLSMFSPVGIGGILFRGAYKTLGPAAGATGLAARAQRIGAAAGSGAITSVAEGAGRDISTGETDGMLDKSIDRGIGGALGGAGGEGLGQVGGWAAKKIAEGIGRAYGRPVFGALEEGGYRFDPIRGTVEPPAIKDMWTRALGSGVSPAEDVARRARGPITDAVNEATKDLHIVQSADTSGYMQAAKATLGRAGYGNVPLNNTRAAVDEVLKKYAGMPFDPTSQLQRELGQLPERMDVQQFDTFLETLGKKANQYANDEVLSGALRRIQRGAQEDLKFAPKVGGEEWPAMRARHNAENVSMESDRQLTGVRQNSKTAALSTEDELAGTYNAIRNVGAKNAPAAVEQSLLKYAPPDVAMELKNLRAMRMASALGTDAPEKLASRRGTFEWLHGKLTPRVYAAGKDLSEDVGIGLELSDKQHLSDKLFDWLNARSPRATQFMAGMDMGKFMAEQDALSKRPKFVHDLTPEQKAILAKMME